MMTVIYRLARSRGKVVRAFGDDKFDVPLLFSREFAERRKYGSGSAPARGGVDKHDIDGLRSRMGRWISRLAVLGGAFLAVRHGRVAFGRPPRTQKAGKGQRKRRQLTKQRKKH